MYAPKFLFISISPLIEVISESSNNSKLSISISPDVVFKLHLLFKNLIIISPDTDLAFNLLTSLISMSPLVVSILAFSAF